MVTSSVGVGLSTGTANIHYITPSRVAGRGTLGALTTRSHRLLIHGPYPSRPLIRFGQTMRDPLQGVRLDDACAADDEDAVEHPLHAFRLDQRGLARVFGELEAAIMDTVWTSGEVTVAAVCAQLAGSANYKTVMTVMNRLVEKRVLWRHRTSRAFTYGPQESRAAFHQRVSRSVAEGLVLDFGESAVAQFVDALDSVDPALLAKLRRLVAERTPTDDPA
jgi:predicted transcriptional regulator